MGFDSLKTTNLKLNPYQYRVEINPNVMFANACLAERSILKLLGFGSQSKVFETPQRQAVEFKIFDPNKYKQAKLCPSIKRISNMYDYSDIVEQSPVVIVRYQS